MAGHGAKFDRLVEQAAVAVLTQRSSDEAANLLGIGASTLERWKKRPEFQAAFLKARRDAYSQSLATLQHGSSAAAKTLLKIILDQNTTASTKVRAAEVILSYAGKGIELEDILKRLAELEALAGISKPDGKE